MEILDIKDKIFLNKHSSGVAGWIYSKLHYLIKRLGHGTLPKASEKDRKIGEKK